MKTALRRLRGAFATWHERDEFVRPVATLVSGTTAAYLLTYAARPIITRLFTAEMFGLLTFFIALATIVGTVASGRYGDALMLPKTDEGAANLLALGGGLVAVTSMGTAAAIPWRTEIATWFGQESLAAWFFLVPPAVLATGWMQLAETWYTRQNRFRTISGGRFLRSGITTGIQVAGGIAGLGAGALIGGHVAGSLAAALLLAALIGYQYRRIVRTGIEIKKIGGMAVRYSRFVRYSTPATLLNNAISRLPILLLLFFFASDIVGYFGIAYSTLAVPLGLVTGAVGQVFFIRAAEAHQDNRLPRLTSRVHRRLIALGMFPTLAAVVAGPSLFSFVFGAEWDTAGIHARYLAAWIYLGAVASPLTRLFDVLEQQRADLLFSVLMFAVLCTTLVAGGFWGTALQTIAWFGCAGAALRLAHIALLVRLAEVPLALIPRHLIRYLALSGPFLLVVLAADHFLGNAATFALTLVTGMAYLALIAWDDMRQSPEE